MTLLKRVKLWSGKVGKSQSEWKKKEKEKLENILLDLVNLKKMENFKTIFKFEKDKKRFVIFKAFSEIFT